MSRYKKQQSPFYQGDLIFIFGVFFIISVLAIYAAGQFGQYGDNAYGRNKLFIMLWGLLPFRYCCISIWSSLKN